MTPPNPLHTTRTLRYGKAAIAEAARLILAGEPVAVPTETVYGLAADATNPAAVARIYAAKGRPDFNPLIVHIPDLAAAERLGVFDERALAAARTFWPGALTLVVPLREAAGLAPAVTAGLRTVALRCPAHPAMQDLLSVCGRPLAAPSANVSGTISPTAAGHVAKTLAGRIALIVDGGATTRGLESTIVAFTGGAPRLLRPGPVPLEDIARHLPPQHSKEEPRNTTPAIEAPGQLPSHYAPSKPLRLEAHSARPDEYMIGFGSFAGDASLSPTGNLEEAAMRLFDLLHRADASARPRIAVAPVPGSGIGEAINDRLRRAAAPRK